jgi:phytoene synthase
MSQRELDAAGISYPRLRLAYGECRRLNAQHGRTYFLATRMLSPPQRPAIHSLYGFARRLDDVVDEPAPDASAEQLARILSEEEQALLRGLAAGHSEDALLCAVIDTASRYQIPQHYFRSFFHSMRMDLTVHGYADRVALDEYVHGSAEVIGLQVLPVLGTVTDLDEAAPHAAALGKAFQLTNFLRDVAEDLNRNRVYLPADELAAYGVDRELLWWCALQHRTEPRVRAALADQIATTRIYYRRAKPGIAMLHPISRPCVATALRLYSEILRRIEAADYNVFAWRAAASRRRKLVVAAGALARAYWARYRHVCSNHPLRTETC